LLLVLAGAYIYPLPTHIRVRADAEAIANGGRREDFFVNLDKDRITPMQEVLVAAFPEPRMVRTGNQVIRAELFKVRNSGREVIGIASRMTGAVPNVLGEPELAVNWVVLLPSRGSFVLAQGPSVAAAILPANAQIVQGEMIAGDQDFASLSGSYVQATTLEDTDNDGVEEAIVLLSTRLKSEES
jgi:hypothetical protein